MSTSAQSRGNVRHKSLLLDKNRLIGFCNPVLTKLKSRLLASCLALSQQRSQYLQLEGIQWSVFQATTLFDMLHKSKHIRPNNRLWLVCSQFQCPGMGIQVHAAVLGCLIGLHPVQMPLFSAVVNQLQFGSSSLKVDMQRTEQARLVGASVFGSPHWFTKRHDGLRHDR